MIVAVVLGIGALCGLLWLGNGVRRIGAVSRGTAIGSRPGTALILIDLQTVFWDSGPYSEAAKAAAEQVIRSEIDAAKAAGHPIVAVRQEWSLPATKVIARLTMGGRAIAGTAGTEIAAPFAEVADQILVKRVQDAFETGELDAVLKRLNVGTLRLVGLDLNYCVAKTALAGQQRGYAVQIPLAATLAAAPTDKMRRTLQERSVALL